MKNCVLTASLLLVCLSTFSAARAQVFFSDNFNTDSNVNDVNYEYNASGRQSGTVAPIQYTVYQPYDYAIQLGNFNNNSLLLAGTTAPGIGGDADVSPNADFTEAVPVLQMSYDFNTQSNGFLSFTFGTTNRNQDAFPNVAGNDSILISGTGGYQIFQDGSEIGDGNTTIPSSTDLDHVVVTLTAEDGVSSFDGNGSMVTISNNGVVLDSFLQTFSDNYITLTSYAGSNGLNVSEVENLSVGTPVAAPEPATVAYMLAGLLALGGLSRLRKKTVL